MAANSKDGEYQGTNVLEWSVFFLTLLPMVASVGLTQREVVEPISMGRWTRRAYTAQAHLGLEVHSEMMKYRKYLKVESKSTRERLIEGTNELTERTKEKDIRVQAQTAAQSE